VINYFAGASMETGIRMAHVIRAVFPNVSSGTTTRCQRVLYASSAVMTRIHITDIGFCGEQQGIYRIMFN